MLTFGGLMLTFGNTPVPYTVSWTAEERTFVAVCPHVQLPAICQDAAPGIGQPRFGKPHFGRQREAIAQGLCDICGKSLKIRTKVSLSHARVRTNAARGPAILQVEPLLHRECAAESLRYCPSLKKDIRNGTLRIRQVSRYRVQIAIADNVFVGEYVPGYVAQPSERIAGHAKVELLKWTDRDAAWLLSDRRVS